MDNIKATRNHKRLDGEDEINSWSSEWHGQLSRGCKHEAPAYRPAAKEPISNILASFTYLGRHLFDSFVQWIQMYLESLGRHRRQVPICKRRVRSRDLKSVQFLGQGFSGFVYETTWSTWYGKERLGRFARKDFPRVESMVFENEAARLVNLDHPNVVKAFCWTVDRLGCSLVLEFVNTDIESVVEKRKKAQSKVSASKDLFPLGKLDKSINGKASPFDIFEAIYIMLHIARAMEYLHSNGIGHGDLRPNNILVDLEADPMIVKVVDFGLIESKKRATLVSKRAQFVRTLEWKAPETWKDLPTSLIDSPDEYLWEELDTVQVMGSASVVDERADVYSFAITCAYIMGGKVSYPKSSLSGLQQRISSGTLRPEVPSTCPELLRKLIESSWDSDPDKRRRFLYIREQLENLRRDEPASREEFFTATMKAKNTPLFHSALFHIPHQYRTLRMEYDGKQQCWTVIEEPWISSDHNKVHWSEDDGSSDDKFAETNLEVFGSLKNQWRHFFLDTDDTLVLGEKIGEGGQAEIFAAHWPDRIGAMPDCDGVVLKVFKGTSLPVLDKQWPFGFLKYVDHANELGLVWNPRLCHIFCGLLLNDGRFAFAMERYWADLRTLLDTRMKHNGGQAPPFSSVVAKRIMLEIAEGVQALHELDVLHRDLKASNIFLKPLDTAHLRGWGLCENDAFSCVVADFECSIGVVGTLFWRAPEILLAIKNRNLNPTVFTPAVDAYSYSMTCYEVLTGQMPFEGIYPHDYRFVIDGARPRLPEATDPALKTLLSRCWHADPRQRPSFIEICEELRIMITSKKEG